MPLRKAPRQQVAVACCATNTGSPRRGVCFPSFNGCDGTSRLTIKSFACSRMTRSVFFGDRFFRQLSSEIAGGNWSVPARQTGCPDRAKTTLFAECQACFGSNRGPRQFDGRFDSKPRRCNTRTSLCATRIHVVTTRIITLVTTSRNIRRPAS